MDFIQIFTALIVIIFSISIVKIIKASKVDAVKFFPNSSVKGNNNVLGSYNPYCIKTDDLVKNLAALKLSEGCIRMPASAQVSFEMYPILSWNVGYDYRNSFLKCYAIARPKKAEFQFTYRDVIQDAVVKISEGTIESNFNGTTISIRFQGRLFGSFDFETHKIFDGANVEIGTFTVPDSIKLKTSIMFDVQAFNRESAYEFTSEIFKGTRKMATVLLQPATFEVVEDIADRDIETDFPLFNGLNIQSHDEAILVLGFAISFLALLENTRSTRGE